MCGEEMDPIKVLQAKLDLKNQEKEIIRLQIQKAKLDAQMSRLKLQARGVVDESLIPADMLSGGKVQATDLKTQEHKRLLEWLAENCDMSYKVAFDVPDPEVHVGAHCAILGHMLQWRLSVQGGVKLSIPLENEMMITEIFRKSKLGLLGNDELEQFAEDWLLVTTDLAQADNVVTPALFLIHKESQKAIVVSAWPSISVAEQPSPPTASFDPTAFFSRAAPILRPPLVEQPTPLVEAAEGDSSTQQLEEAEALLFIGTAGEVNRLTCPAAGGMLWTRDCGPLGILSRPLKDLGVRFSQVNEQFTLSGPFGFTVVAKPLPGQMQRWFVCGLVALALEHGVSVRRCITPVRRNSAALEEMEVPASCCEEAPAPSCDEAEPASQRRDRSMSWTSGERVEVQYNGSWFQGVLQATQGEVAHVQCDVDESGVITVAPLESVRHADYNEHLTEGQNATFPTSARHHGDFNTHPRQC